MRKLLKNFKISIFFLFLFTSCFNRQPVVLSIPDSAEPQNLEEAAFRETHIFTFSIEQQQLLKRFYNQNGDAALQLTLHGTKFSSKKIQNGTVLEIGFLYAGDYGDKGDFKNIAPRPLVSADLKDFATSSFSVIFCMERHRSISDELPVGFFVRSASKFVVESTAVVRATVGFDFRSQIPVFAFAPNGGLISPTVSATDLSGASMAFSSVSSYQSVMPELAVTFKENSSKDIVRLSIGGERFSLWHSGENDTSYEAVIPLAAAKNPFSPVEISENAASVSSILLRASDSSILTSYVGISHNPTKPIRVDPGLIFNWSQNNWRGTDYELFEWNRFENILIFDTANYEIQNEFFSRLAFFVEKHGYCGKLMDDEFLKTAHGYNAHDYRAESLANFFETARVRHFPLNERELLLKEILCENGVLKIGDGGEVLAGDGGVISISKESTVEQRRMFIAHEGWHGIFFVDADFRNTVASLYYTVDSSYLDFLMNIFLYLPNLRYETKDDYLMKNEFMAYMLQQPVAACSDYYMERASWRLSGPKMGELSDYVLSKKAEGFVSAATLLDQYVNDRWGLNAGRVWLIF
ncbi:hypothetical protein [Treponema zioleckii]|uniref:hypothetical protein n=1 Tax=Treponema zioleckii TaxID=331680 RepID=UPI00168B5F12|nr:hypothetical protein [Treponema zioleckii]